MHLDTTERLKIAETAILRYSQTIDYYVEHLDTFGLQLLIGGLADKTNRFDEYGGLIDALTKWAISHKMSPAKLYQWLEESGCNLGIDSSQLRDTRKLSLSLSAADIAILSSSSELESHLEGMNDSEILDFVGSLAEEILRLRTQVNCNENADKEDR